MRQKTIICICGVHDSSKSNTIKILREGLIERYEDTDIYTSRLPDGKVLDVLVCDGHKVGIESIGDNSGNLNLHDNLNDCDIYVHQVRNNVTRDIKHLADNYGYRIIEMINYRVADNSFIMDELNQLLAIHLVDLIDKIITGSI